jgi:ABC-2 type transport system permease protein
MPGWLQWFAERQPITPITETLRALLVGGEGQPVVALAWCLGMLVLAGVLATLAFRRRLRAR